MVQVMSRAFTRLMHPLYDRMILVLTLLFCAGLAVMFLHVLRLQANLLESIAFSHAEVYTQAMAELQSLYDSELVGQVRAHGLKHTLSLTALLALLWAGGLGLVFSKLRKSSQLLEVRVHQRTSELREANQKLQCQMAEREKAERELQKAHNELELRVKERTAKLEQANVDLTVEISERKRAEEDIQQLNKTLIQQKDQLEASNKELEAFSYSVAHDLRAPLRGIDGFSQAVLDDYGPDLNDQGQQYLLRVREASQRMAKLIDAMLDLARLTRAEVHPEVVDLSALARRVVEDFQQTDPDRQVEVKIAGGLKVTADAGLISVVLENLIGNAWKFTSEVSNPLIEFGVVYRYAQSVYFIRDNGAGFDMTYVHKLFGAFQRLHAMNEFPGMGIGLATVKRILDRHGGRIWPEAAVGYGATFFFSFDSEGGSP